MNAKITYFKSGGRENTNAVMQIVKERAGELGIKTVVVASYRGYTAEKAVCTLDGMEIVVIAGFPHPTMQNIPEIYSKTGVEEFLADGVIVIYHIKKGNLRERAIEVLKLRGVAHKSKIVAMQIVSEKGIEVYPEQQIFGNIE